MRCTYVEVEVEYLTDDDRQVATVWATVYPGEAPRRSGHPDTWEPGEVGCVEIDRIEVWSDVLEHSVPLDAVGMEAWEREHREQAEEACREQVEAEGVGRWW